MRRRDAARAQCFFGIAMTLSEVRKKPGGDLRQTNQFDQRLWSGINTTADALGIDILGTYGGSALEPVSET
jgi:hypothetical protein